MQAIFTRCEIVIITVTTGVAKHVAVSSCRVIVPFPYLMVTSSADVHW